MEAATESARTMKTLLISVAAIVFIVSGIGIMNVLFISVRERTREIITKPALLLADKPTGSLDSATGKEILSLFQELNEAGNTIVMISHDKQVAEQSRRIVSISDGNLSA